MSKRVEELITEIDKIRKGSLYSTIKNYDSGKHLPYRYNKGRAEKNYKLLRAFEEELFYLTGMSPEDVAEIQRLSDASFENFKEYSKAFNPYSVLETLKTDKVKVKSLKDAIPYKDEDSAKKTAANRAKRKLENELKNDIKESKKTNKNKRKPKRKIGNVGTDWIEKSTNKNLKKILTEDLTPEEVNVLIEVCINQKTFIMVGEEMGITRQTASKIFKRASNYIKNTYKDESEIDDTDEDVDI